MNGYEYESEKLEDGGIGYFCEERGEWRVYTKPCGCCETDLPLSVAITLPVFRERLDEYIAGLEKQLNIARNIRDGVNAPQ